jgi:hypothetical protein
MPALETVHMTVFELTPVRGEHPVVGRVSATVHRLWRCGVASTHAGQLDELICRGDLMSAPELCEARARQLVKLRRRVAIAAQIETCVEAAATDLGVSRRRTSVWLADLRETEVRAAAAELLELACALRSRHRVEPRGVAMAMLLIRDGESPLYVAGGSDIAQAANAARAALSAPSSG